MEGVMTHVDPRVSDTRVQTESFEQDMERGDRSSRPDDGAFWNESGGELVVITKC